MKTFAFLSVSILLALSSNGFSQNQNNDVFSSEQTKLTFVPNSFEPIPLFHSYTISKEKSYTILYSVGSLLQGLKFHSAVDQFNATAPFDFRGFEPKNFKSYTSLIKENQLLLNPIQSLK